RQRVREGYGDPGREVRRLYPILRSAIMKDHRNRAHALLSASGSARWLNCPPSARLEDEVEDKTSPAALEGTLAHELAELELSYSQGRVSEENYTITRSEIESNEYYDSEMEQHVEDYVDY